MTIANSTIKTTEKKAKAKPKPKANAKVLTVEDSGNVLGGRSKRKLQGVNPEMENVVELALKYSLVDFGVNEGVRSMARQRQLMREGKTKTFHSKHLDGSAVDLLAYVDGKYTYEPWDLYVTIAEAMFKAAKELDVKIMWGACWLDETSKFETAEKALAEYKKVRKSQGRKPFLDAVHFELWDGRTHY